MALQNGQLLIHRMQVTLQVGDNDIDTGLQEVSKALPPDPTMAQRTMIIVLPPTDNWAGITIPSDPTFSTVTNTVHVNLHNANGAPVTLNVLFWLPHTSVGPVSVDTYVIV